MAGKNNAFCSICGKPYHMCLSCKDQMRLQPWKMHTDTSEHYKIYQTLHGYNVGVYDKEEAKSKLQNIDLSDFDSLRDDIKNIINDITGEDETAMSMVVATEAVNLLNETDVSDKEESVFEQTKVARRRKSLRTTGTEQ